MKSRFRRTQDAADYLGMSAKHLRRLARIGTLRLGRDYIITSRPHAARPTYAWDCEQIAKTLSIGLEYRK
ncbi:DNA-binding protein [Thermosynechococcus sp. FA-CM-4201]